MSSPFVKVCVCALRQQKDKGRIGKLKTQKKQAKMEGMMRPPIMIVFFSRPWHSAAHLLPVPTGREAPRKLVRAQQQKRDNKRRPEAEYQNTKKCSPKKTDYDETTIQKNNEKRPQETVSETSTQSVRSPLPPAHEEEDNRPSPASLLLSSYRTN